MSPVAGWKFAELFSGHYLCEACPHVESCADSIDVGGTMKPTIEVVVPVTYRPTALWENADSFGARIKSGAVRGGRVCVGIVLASVVGSIGGALSWAL